MIVSKLRYKGYLWQYNPKELSVITEKKLHEQLVPDNKPIIQNFGNKSRIIRGTGCLCGEDCFKQYNRILELQKNGSGILSLPNTNPFYAFLKVVELACDPTPDLISYKFEFVEDLSKINTGKKEKYYSVKRDETLWHIANAHNILIDNLVKLNPQIKRLDELTQGEKIRLC